MSGGEHTLCPCLGPDQGYTSQQHLLAAQEVVAEDLGIGSDPGLELYREKRYWPEGIRGQSEIIISCMCDVASVGGQ